MRKKGRWLRLQSILRRIISGKFVWSVHSTRGSPGMNRFVVSIVREYRSNAAQFHGGIDGIQIAAPCFLQSDSAGWLVGCRWTRGGTGSTVRDIYLENGLERRVQRP